MRLLLTLQYLGTRYAGWQSQTNATAVQNVVEDVLTKVYGSPIRVEGASRTDAGVHAAGQRAHADVPFEIAPRGLIRGINDLLPADIRVTNVEQVGADFQCRHRAKSKTYVYAIWNHDVADVFASETHAHVGQRLDDALMHDAAQVLVGEHDFRAFTVAAPEVRSTVRTISNIAVTRKGPLVAMTLSADGFLRYMVRRIAGSLIEIGRGKIEAEALSRSLEPRFEAARWTAPAKGLTLVEVAY